jgi:hypothetical protein
MSVSIKNTILKTISKIKKKNYYKFNTSFIKKINLCPICNSIKKKIISNVIINNKNINQTSFCEKCSHIYRSKTFNNNWFKKCWSLIKENKPKIINPTLEKHRKNRYKSYIKIIKKYNSNINLNTLDIGAAFGSGSEILRSAKFNVECLEPEINRFNILKKKKFVTHNNFLESFKSKNKFDVIIAAHILEHCLDLKKSLTNLKNLLKGINSIVYIEVPYIKSYLDFFDIFYLPHRNNFLFKNIIYLLKKNGFKILESKINFYSDEKKVISIVVKINSNNSNNKISKNIQNFDIYKLYKRKSPFKNIKFPINVIADYISNFFYIIRVDRGNFLLKNNYIYFKHKSR